MAAEVAEQDAVRRGLRQLTKTDPDPRVRRRAQTLLLVEQGQTLASAARLMGTAAHRIQQMEERLAHGADWNPHELVFVTTHGTAYARTNWRTQQYIPMISKAGLPYIRPHDLRHTAATLLLLEGVQPLVVSEMLGHT